MCTSGTTISIIDADSSTSERLASLLKTTGANIKTYISAEDFLLDPSTDQHVYLITESNLPGINGLELLKKLKQLNWTAPIILLTSQSNVSIAVNALRAGAVDCFEKPINEYSFLHRVNQLLSNSS